MVMKCSQKQPMDRDTTGSDAKLSEVTSYEYTAFARAPCSMLAAFRFPERTLHGFRRQLLRASQRIHRRRGQGGQHS